MGFVSLSLPDTPTFKCSNQIHSNVMSRLPILFRLEICPITEARHSPNAVFTWRLKRNFAMIQSWLKIGNVCSVCKGTNKLLSISPAPRAPVYLWNKSSGGIFAGFRAVIGIRSRRENRPSLLDREVLGFFCDLKHLGDFMQSSTTTEAHTLLTPQEWWLIFL